MQYFFGFEASPTLVQYVNDAQNAFDGEYNSKQMPFYWYRNRVIEQCAQEMVQALVLDMHDKVRQPVRKQAIKTLGVTLQKASQVLLKIMLNRDSNEKVRSTKSFFDKTIAINPQGNMCVGFPVSQQNYELITQTFAQVKQNDDIETITQFNTAQKEQIKKALFVLNELVLNHFIIEFGNMLGWGMLKMHGAKSSKLAITKANSVVIERIVNNLAQEDLQQLLEHFEVMFFNC